VDCVTGIGSNVRIGIGSNKKCSGSSQNLNLSDTGRQMAESLHVAIVDQSPIFRQGVAHALRRDFTIVAEGRTGEDAERLMRERAPDILLMQVDLPGNLRAAQAILQAHWNVKVILLANAEDDELAMQALRAGAHGYILKRIAGPELVGAIKAVSRGERYITPDFACRLVARPMSRPAQQPAVRSTSLGTREQQVLDCTSRGMRNQEIANMLGLSLSTIKYYKTLAFRKMRVRNRLEAIVAMNEMQN
jgi:DNA-binding NarL/FixJ family response regulator